MECSRVGFLKLVVPTSIAQTALWGVLYYSFSVFLGPIHNSLKWSSDKLTFGYSAAILISGIVAIPFGRWIDLYGARLPLILGSIGAAGCLFFLSMTNNYLVFVLLWCCLGFIMAATLQTVNMVYMQHMSHLLHRAVIVSSLFTGMSAAIFIPITQWMVNTIGWRLALLPLSLICIVCGLIFYKTIPNGNGSDRDNNAETAEIRTSEKKEIIILLKSWRLWGVMLAFAGNSAISTSLSLLLISILQIKGYNTWQISIVFFLSGPAQILVRFILALKKNITNNLYIGILALILQTLSLIVLLYSTSNSSTDWLVYVFSIANGITGGLTLIVSSLIIAELSGLRYYGLIQGVLKTSTTLARSLSAYFISLATYLYSDMNLSVIILIVISFVSLLSFISVTNEIFTFK